MGTASPERWQLAHLLKTIGATSLAKLGIGFCEALVRVKAVTATTAVIAMRKTSVRFMHPPSLTKALTQPSTNRPERRPLEEAI
jgi:hypothetical protein